MTPNSATTVALAGQLSCREPRMKKTSDRDDEGGVGSHHTLKICHEICSSNLLEVMERSIQVSLRKFFSEGLQQTFLKIAHELIYSDAIRKEILEEGEHFSVASHVVSGHESSQGRVDLRKGKRRLPSL